MKAITVVIYDATVLIPMLLILMYSRNVIYSARDVTWRRNLRC